ncbi:HlyD family efflux transporter periplasmic adaptor subunit [Maioricimonas rarisocia]|uniref:HlyD family efflux transporter periplasmic adaptor subunit n=1 Tax=Maioricimonas rarisocia TaxID=2528026 RepID=UPI0018D24A4B|nr:HlyD family efflux transporter periplasmic adaptor subunit [Maioricimonas rarisocia]
MILLFLCAVGAGAFYALPFALKATSSRDDIGVLTFPVQTQRLRVTVTADGTIESASNVDIKCLVPGGSTVLSIVPDGTEVDAGDEIIRLDSSQIEDELSTQKINYERALATKIQSEEDYAASTIAVQEYEQGTFVQELQQAEAQIKIALENLRSAENVLKYSERMVRKGFVTPLQRDADAFAVERAKLDLEVAETAKKVLVEFTKPKMMKELIAKREAAAAKLRSDEAALELEQAKLERLEKQLANCVITAPQRGMVVYANERGRRGSSGVEIEEGAVVREQQTIVRLPDLTRMQVKVTVHESKVDQLKVGMPARIVIQDRELSGNVVSVANQPEPNSFFSANVKEYATTVAIDGETKSLRPGMSAEVEILLADLPDRVVIPISSVVERRGKFYCWVEAGDEHEKRPLKLGATDDTYIEVVDGVKVGDLVLRNPRAVLAEARMEVTDGDSEDDEDSFGPAGDREKPSPGGPPAGGPGAGPRTTGPGEGGPDAQRRFDPMQFDADGDGKLSLDEAPERMKARFADMDADGDGFATRAEVNAFSQKMRAQRESEGGGPPAAGGGRPE